MRTQFEQAYARHKLLRGMRVRKRVLVFPRELKEAQAWQNPRFEGLRVLVRTDRAFIMISAGPSSQLPGLARERCVTDDGFPRF